MLNQGQAATLQPTTVLNEKHGKKIRIAVAMVLFFGGGEGDHGVGYDLDATWTKKIK